MVPGILLQMSLESINADAFFCGIGGCPLMLMSPKSLASIRGSSSWSYVLYGMHNKALMLQAF